MTSSVFVYSCLFEERMRHQDESETNEREREAHDNLRLLRWWCEGEIHVQSRIPQITQIQNWTEKIRQLIKRGTFFLLLLKERTDKSLEEHQKIMRNDEKENLSLSLSNPLASKVVSFVPHWKFFAAFFISTVSTLFGSQCWLFLSLSGFLSVSRSLTHFA